MIRRTWVPCDSKGHLDLYVQILDKARELGYLQGEGNPPLYWFPATTKRLGCCSYNWKHSYNLNGSRRGTSDGIAITKGYEAYPAIEAAEILVHEVAHFCAVAKYGSNGVGHGQIFKSIASKLGVYYGAPNAKNAAMSNNTTRKIIAAVKEKSRAEAQYEVYCPKCGHVFGHYKTLCAKVRNAEYWFHTCSGERVFLKARKIKTKEEPQ